MMLIHSWLFNKPTYLELIQLRPGPNSQGWISWNWCSRFIIFTEHIAFLSPNSIKPLKADFMLLWHQCSIYIDDRPLIRKKLNGHISTMRHPIHLMFSSMYGFLDWQIKLHYFWFEQNSNGHISTTGHPIHSVFGTRVGCLGSVDRMVLFPVR